MVIFRLFIYIILLQYWLFIHNTSVIYPFMTLRLRETTQHKHEVINLEYSPLAQVTVHVFNVKTVFQYCFNLWLNAHSDGFK